MLIWVMVRVFVFLNVHIPYTIHTPIHYGVHMKKNFCNSEKEFLQLLNKLYSIL